MQITRSGHHYPLKRWASWRDEVIEQLRVQLPAGFQTITVPVHLTVNYWPGDARKRDVAGMLDALGHCFEWGKGSQFFPSILSDDTFISNVSWYTHPIDRENPRAECFIEPKP